MDKLKIGDRLRERIIDGCEPEPVKVVRVGALTACAPGRHCAAHGSGPVYGCCKCGAAFEPTTNGFGRVIR